MTSTAPTSAADFLRALREARAPAELPRIRQRLTAGDDAIGMRMRDVFDTSRAAMSMPLDEVEELFASRVYEARLGALCILDFRARSPRTQEAERARMYELYLGHHDRITTWDMVDAPLPVSSAAICSTAPARSCTNWPLPGTR